MHADHIDAAGLRTLIPWLRVESGKNLSLSVGEYSNEKPSQMTCRLWLPSPSASSSFCILRASYAASASYYFGEDVVSYELSIETSNSLVGDLLNIPLSKAVPLITLKRQPGKEFVPLFRYLPFVQNKNVDDMEYLGQYNPEIVDKLLSVFELQGWTIESLVEFFLLVQAKGAPDYFHGALGNGKELFLAHHKWGCWDHFRYVMSPDDVASFSLSPTLPSEATTQIQ